MSFLEALRKAREEAKSNHEKYKEITSVNIEQENNNNIPEEKEVETETNVDTSFITLGDAIIKQSAESVIKYKKLRGGTNASRRIAKAIASKQITISQHQKAIQIQKRYNPKRPDWHIVGSWALKRLDDLLNKGVSLNDALNSEYIKEEHNE